MSDRCGRQFGQEGDILAARQLEFASDYMSDNRREAMKIQSSAPDVHGQIDGESGVPPYRHDFDTYYPEQHKVPAAIVRTNLERIRSRINDMRWHSGLDERPYQEGIEGLKTSIICVLNILDDLTAYIRDGGLEHGSDD